MSRLDDIEKSPRFQALCKEAFRDGGFRHAHPLRALARSINHLVQKGHTILSTGWDVREQPDVELSPEKAPRAVCGPYWTRCIPGRWARPKLPGLTRCDVKVIAAVTAGARIQLQVETSNFPVDLSGNGNAGRTIDILGDGDLNVYTIENVQISSGPLEAFGLWCRGQYTETIGDIVAHGNPAKDSIEWMDLQGRFQIGGVGAWVSGGANDTWAIDHALVVHDGAGVDEFGNVLFVGQFVAVLGSAAAQVWKAPANFFEAESLRGRYFQIRELPKIRIVGLGIYLRDG